MTAGVTVSLDPGTWVLTEPLVVYEDGSVRICGATHYPASEETSDEEA